MKIAIAGIGYVCMSLATLISQRHSVVAVDVVPEKVDAVNRRQSPVQDEYIERYFAEKELDLVATLDAENAYRDASFVIIATPTNYDPKKNFFDTSSVEKVIFTPISHRTAAASLVHTPLGYASVSMKFSPVAD